MSISGAAARRRSISSTAEEHQQRRSTSSTAEEHQQHGGGASAAWHRRRRIISTVEEHQQHGIGGGELAAEEHQQHGGGDSLARRRRYIKRSGQKKNGQMGFTSTHMRNMFATHPRTDNKTCNAAATKEASPKKKRYTEPTCKIPSFFAAILRQRCMSWPQNVHHESEGASDQHQVVRPLTCAARVVAGLALARHPLNLGT